MRLDGFIQYKRERKPYGIQAKITFYPSDKRSNEKARVAGQIKKWEAFKVLFPSDRNSFKMALVKCDRKEKDCFVVAKGGIVCIGSLREAVESRMFQKPHGKFAIVSMEEENGCVMMNLTQGREE